jgi:putative membrane protein
MHLPDWAADGAAGIVAAIHFAISFAEIFLWRRVYPRLKQFDFSPKEGEKVRPIVQNVGLYNAFLGAALLWNVFARGGAPSFRYLLLICVAVAGVFGAVTLKAPKTLALQTAPALAAICLMWLAEP